MVSNLAFESSYLSSNLGPQNKKKRVQKSYAVELQIIWNYALQEIIWQHLYQLYQCGSFCPSSRIIIQMFCMVKLLLQELNLITVIQIFCMSIEIFYILMQIYWILGHMQKFWIKPQMVSMMVQLEGQKLPYW